MTSIFSKLNSNSLALVLFPIIFIPLVFYNTTFAMMRVWMVNETFTHGFLVMPLAIWLIWRKKSQILLLKPSPEPGVFLVLILLLICWLISAAVGVEIAQQFFMVTIIIITIWIAAGRQVVLNALFPLMFLYFLVPFGQVFIPPLMQYTANFTVALIKLVGVPVYQDGLSFVLPTGSWSVVEECSGVRYLTMPVLDISTNPEKTQEELQQLCKISIEEDGADVIVLGCTGLSYEVDLDPIMLNLGIPILDPWVVAVKTAFMLVESGLSHSKVAYPFPPKKKINEAPSLKGAFDDILKE